MPQKFDAAQIIFFFGGGTTRPCIDYSQCPSLYAYDRFNDHSLHTGLLAVGISPEIVTLKNSGADLASSTDAARRSAVHFLILFSLYLFFVCFVKFCTTFIANK